MNAAYPAVKAIQNCLFSLAISFPDGLTDQIRLPDFLHPGQLPDGFNRFLVHPAGPCSHFRLPWPALALTLTHWRPFQMLIHHMGNVTKEPPGAGPGGFQEIFLERECFPGCLPFGVAGFPDSLIVGNVVLLGLEGFTQLQLVAG